jgi:uncharacterized membrane protein (DUF4010 family)
VEADVFKALGIALGLGLLFGLQREWGDEHRLAGIRTFALITLLGAITALLARDYGGWVVAAGLLALAGLLIIGNWLINRGREEVSAGQTSETAALVMFGVGALLVAGYTMPAVVLGGATAVLLHSKPRLQRLVGSLSDTDARAIFQFVLLALVILPLLPNETYGPYDVLNPFKIWMMVVLIVGISLVAYVAYRIVGARAGSILGGIFGGLISSTATTVSFARQGKRDPGAVGTAALVIVIASTIVLVRVVIEIAAVARGLLPELVLPFGAIFVLMAGISAWLHFRLRQGNAQAPEHGNPSQLKPAIVFGALYGVILLLVAFVKDYFGDRAIYAAAVISGLTDVDALTLSVAELFNQDRVSGDMAWRSILLATLSNLAFKAGAAGVLGGSKLFRIVGPAFGATIAAGLGVIFLWP